ncbi:MAG: AAA family ATPase, partial [Lachnospiraceae bacterium]|nr:AAA family ATPase [Lachnospiraceae bacterium]
MEQADLSQKLTAFRDQMNSRFVGKKEVVENLLCCFLAGGHILLEDVPGVGKTTLARTFAGSLGLSFGRIQFTPDTMPGDVTGMTIYDMKSGEFHYRPGA